MDAESEVVRDAFCGGEIFNMCWVDRRGELLVVSADASSIGDSANNDRISGTSSLLMVNVDEMRFLERYELEMPGSISSVCSTEGVIMIGTSGGVVKIAKDVRDASIDFQDSFVDVNESSLNPIRGVDMWCPTDGLICTDKAEIYNLRGNDSGIDIQRIYDGLLIDGSISQVKFLQDGNLALFSNITGQVKLLDLRGPKRIQGIFQTNLYTPHSISIHEDIGGKFLVSGEYGCEEWDLRGGNVPLTFISQTTVFDSIYSPTSGHSVFHACSDGAIRMHQDDPTEGPLELFSDTLPQFTLRFNSSVGRNYVVCGGGTGYLHKFHV